MKLFVFLVVAVVATQALNVRRMQTVTYAPDTLGEGDATDPGTLSDTFPAPAHEKAKRVNDVNASDFLTGHGEANEAVNTNAAGNDLYKPFVQDVRGVLHSPGTYVKPTPPPPEDPLHMLLPNHYIPKYNDDAGEPQTVASVGELPGDEHYAHHAKHVHHPHPRHPHHKSHRSHPRLTEDDSEEEETASTIVTEDVEEEQVEEQVEELQDQVEEAEEEYEAAEEEYRDAQAKIRDAQQAAAEAEEEYEQLEELQSSDDNSEDGSDGSDGSGSEMEPIEAGSSDAGSADASGSSGEEELAPIGDDVESLADLVDDE